MRLLLMRKLSRKQSFNPRICKRCDYEATTVNEAGHVSIHASVKDATVVFLDREGYRTSFNPRICKRCDCTDINN